MNILHGDKRSKVARVVNALGIQCLCYSRGQTLVEKQPHGVGTAFFPAQLLQGLPDGRPRSGCALA